VDWVERGFDRKGGAKSLSESPGKLLCTHSGPWYDIMVVMMFIININARVDVDKQHCAPKALYHELNGHAFPPTFTRGVD
jgi:hypothetical protein